jgi:hypothetical protein
VSLSQELDKLDQLQRQGTLSDAEFTRALARVPGSAAPKAPGYGGARINAWRRRRDNRWLG